ncbi:type IV secretion system protein TrbL [Roseospira visakhapatnamensis]|uniref:Type IV secretion system protein TrbL n=2 Tax=Roseospira visakhapatnamensis TaxID=390880 RepID=A0A7W6RG05_9PROT|nr:type IV secretion system protein TrbL [Roseospira visakhapatnamensis]
MVGFPEVFSNLLSVVVLLMAWVLVIVAFFVLSVQLFITILEFKLTTLAGFVLIPFALWNKTAFLAERVLGAVVAAGIKMMVLAVIVGIGAGLFDTFTEALNAGEPTIEAAMSLVLASLALLGLGIFGPGIAAGLVTGAPQLGAGAVLGTGGAAAGVALIGGGTALAGARLAGTGGLVAVRAGTALGTGAASAFRLGEATSGTSGPGATLAGLGGMARAAGSAATRPLREAAADGRRAAWTATGGTAPAGSAGSMPDPSSSAPAWARRLRTEQRVRARLQDAQQTLRDGDRPGGGTAPSLGDKED